MSLVPTINAPNRSRFTTFTVDNRARSPRPTEHIPANSSRGDSA